MFLSNANAVILTKTSWKWEQKRWNCWCRGSLGTTFASFNLPPKKWEENFFQNPTILKQKQFLNITSAPSDEKYKLANSID